MATSPWRLREMMPITGHVQIASIPSRNEPDGEELNYPFLFAGTRSPRLWRLCRLRIQTRAAKNHRRPSPWFKTLLPEVKGRENIPGPASPTTIIPAPPISPTR